MENQRPSGLVGMRASPVIFLVGATAAGKSELGLALAEKIGGVLLCLDSMQVYRGLDVGTGKPTAEERRKISHGGLDLAEITERFDTARYLEAARIFLAQAEAEGKPVVAVGGTGLYFRALTQGLCEAPPGDPKIRGELAALDLAQLQARLRAVDPGMVPQLDFQNPRRISRAIEVKESTGVSLAEFQENTAPPLVKNFRAYELRRERDDLHDRIERRVRSMLASGWKEETGRLLEKYGAEVLRNCPAIGYPEIAAALRAGGDWEKVAEAITVQTRQYAKRQLTWWKRESTLTPLNVAATDSSSLYLNRLLADREL
jgi:tRNA dimethylallyltransferase